MTVTIQPGTDIAAAIAANPSEVDFVLAAGTHRGMYFEPRANINIRGNGTARLNGSVIVTGWTQHASNVWVTNSPIPGSQVIKKPVVSGYSTVTSAYPRAADAVDLFVDGVRLAHENSIGLATNSNAWYFDYSANKLYVGVNPSGKTLELSTLNYAMRIYSGGNIIEGVVFERYASPLQDGAVEIRASGVRLAGCEFLQNAGVGLKAFADNVVVTQCRINYNGQLGIAGRGNGLQITLNEMRGNNEKRTDEDFEGGASKFSRCGNSVIYENKVWENRGKGLWLDIDNGYGAPNSLRNNIVTENDGEGIHVELSFDTEVYENYVAGNGRGESTRMYESQIFIANSSRVNVYNNIVVVREGSANGIGLHQQSRGNSTLYGVEWLCQDVEIYNNQIVYLHDNFTNMYSGMYADHRVDLINPSNIRWVNNDYYVPASRPAWYQWRVNNQSWLWNTWQANGYDTAGTVTAGGSLAFADEPSWSIGTVTPTLGAFEEYMNTLAGWPQLLFLYDTQDQADPGRDLSANNYDAQLYASTDQVWLDSWRGADGFITGALAAQCAGNHAYKVPSAAQSALNRNEFTLISAFTDGGTDYWEQSAQDYLWQIGGSSTSGFFLFYARRSAGQIQIQLKISDQGSQNTYSIPTPLSAWPPNEFGNFIFVARHSRTANLVKYDLWDGQAWINITTRTSPANGAGTTISGGRFTIGGYDLGSAGDDKYLIYAAAYNTYLDDSYLDDLVDFPAAPVARRRARWPRIAIIA